jgi:hypothetical protein
VDFVGVDESFVKVDGGWRRRNDVGLCLGSRVLGGETWDERQEKKIFGQLRPSVELYREAGGFRDEAMAERRSEEVGRREFKLISEGGFGKRTSVD